MVSNDIGGIGGNGYWGGKTHLLPTRSCFIRERSLRQQRARAAIELPDVGTNVAALLVKAYPGNEATDRGAELHAQLQGLSIIEQGTRGCIGGLEYSAGTTGSSIHRHAHRCGSRDGAGVIGSFGGER